MSTRVIRAKDSEQYNSIYLIAVFGIKGPEFSLRPRRLKGSLNIIS